VVCIKFYRIHENLRFYSIFALALVQVVDNMWPCKAFL